jgi:hypothetical protein
MSNVLPKTLQLHGEEGYLSIHEEHPYLFRCHSADGGLFHDFERALVELNDFCFVLQEGLKHYSYQKKLEVDTDPNNFVGKPQEFREAQENSCVLYMEAYDPALVGKFYFPASTLSLLYFQTISFLKNIARVICGNKFKNKLSSMDRALKEQNGGKKSPEIVVLIELIEKVLGVNTHVFSDTEIKILVLDTLREVRNEYAHGDWGKLGNTLKGVNIVLVFRAVGRMLKLLEEPYSDWESRGAGSESIQAFLEGAGHLSK